MLLEAVRGAGRERLETLQEFDEGSLVVARAEDGSEALLFVPRTAEAGARERERLELLRGPGIPLPGPDAGTPGEAIVLSDAAAARPLPLAGRLPDAVWRPGLVRLLSTLSHVHGHGWVHGRIARGHVLADPSGEFWIHGWAGARSAVGRGPFQTGIDDVGEDLRDLGVAFLRCFVDAPPAAEPLDDAAARRGCARVATFDAELARVLARLAAGDPREGYESATEVLADLGEPDESLPDPFERPPFVGRTAVVRAALRHAERAGTRDAWLASFEIVGAAGSGKSRLLAEIARAARERGLVVLQAQGGAPDQPWGAVGSFARQMVARLPADHALRADRGVRVLVGDAPSPVAREADAAHGDGASAALADLATEAFRGSRALLLLDDEDALSSHALQVWRGLGRHVAAASGSSQAPGVLLVTTSARPSEHELIIPRERVELPDLERRHLVPLVAGLLTERGKAAILAAELHATVGGRPADVVDQLRDMVARGVLRRVGRRFHCDDFADAVRAGCGVDRFRRAADAAGREGVALASVLAVAGRLRLARDVVGEIAEIPAHRLHAAGEAAVRAGLLARDGATWRVRTESLRVRIAASLADDRRRSLHREILARLLDAPDPDWPAIAHHGRAAGDSRAAGWTRSALDVLRAAGRFDEAATHFDDARVLLDASALDVDLRLAQVDTLLHAGRLGDAIRAAEALLADPAATPRHRGAASLALARLHRYDQAWSRVLAVELPVDCGDPIVLARIRLLHATAHAFRGRDDLADREERLAMAELPNSIDAPLRRDRAELAADRATVADAPMLAASNALACARVCRREGDGLGYLLALVRYANAQRRLGAAATSASTLRRVYDVNEAVLKNPLVSAWLHSIRSHLSKDQDFPRQSLAGAEAAALFAARTGGNALVFNKRVQLAYAQAQAGCLPASTGQMIRRIAGSLSSVHGDIFSVVGGALAYLFLFNGLHDAVDDLRDAISSMHVHQGQARLVRFWCRIASFLSDDTTETSHAAGSDPAADIQAIARDAAPSGMSLQPEALMPVRAYLAALIRTGARESKTLPRGWTDEKLLELIDDSRTCSPIGADITFSLILEPRCTLSTPVLDALRARARRQTYAVPLAVEWRRALAYAAIHLQDRRITAARNLAREALRQVSRLCALNPRRYSALRAAHERALRRSGLGLLEEDSTSFARRRRPWLYALETVGAQELAVIVGKSLAELHRFVLEAAAAFGSEVIWNSPRAGSRDEAAHERCVLVSLTSVGVACTGPSRRSLVLVTRAAWHRLDHDTRSQVANHQPCSIVELPDLLSQVEAKYVLLERLHELAPGRWTVDAGVADALAVRAWPRGLEDVLVLAQQLVATGPARQLELRDLEVTGDTRATADAGQTSAPSVVCAVVQHLGDGRWQSSTEIAEATAVPKRTVVRLLSALAARGSVLRAGRGRATRYSLPAARL